MALSLDDVRERLHIGRSAAARLLASGELAAIKRHGCGTVCGSPATCKQGTWEVSEDDYRSYLESALSRSR